MPASRSGGEGMQLSEILPSKTIEGIIAHPIDYLQLGFSQVDRFASLQPDLLHSAGLRIWDRVVTASDIEVDPFCLADRVNARDPMLFNAITQVIGQESMRDLYYVRMQVQDPALSYNTAAQFAVAVTFPNDLLLIDLLLTNPYRPLPKRARKSHWHDYEGYGLLPIVSSNAAECARSLDCTAVTLVAANKALVRIFRRHGFNVEDTITGKAAMEVGLGIPMVMPL